MIEAPTLTNLSLLVLCGGAGTRMHGEDKPLVHWHGKPMVDHVIVSAPTGINIIISANRNLEAYKARGEVVKDLTIEGISKLNLQKMQSPLLGIAAGLQVCETAWLLVSPGDTPALQQEWWQTLLDAWHGQRAVVAHDGIRQQHLHLLLHKSCLDNLLDYLDSGQQAAYKWLAALTPEIAHYADAAQFHNINTPADL